MTPVRPGRPGGLRGLLALLLLALGACSWGGGSIRPQWIDGQSPNYPDSQYLVGVGQAESRPRAEEQAYAALARIFKAAITAEAKDWESYVVVEQGGQTSTERHLTLDKVTTVTSDKVLESVRVLDTWFDQRTRQYYALAGMDRAQAEAAMLERMGALDREIESQVSEARRAKEKLLYARNLKRATTNLVIREAYNTDLRVIRLSGKGLSPAYRLAELTAELEQFLVTNLGMAVALSGPEAPPVAHALVEGLAREGFSVVEVDSEAGGEQADLLIRGTVATWPIEVGDPQFRYVRWCADAVVEDVPTHRVIGAVTKGGKEGHVAEREALSKAVRVMQQEFSANLAKALAAYVYGEQDLMVPVSAPSGCSKETVMPKTGR
ncbi:MAG: hypothetical protein NBKEAIPA_01224 [Nitrospirae bacterium]|nr:MAG: hypothetical protein UZ03_NOB001001596 [Nitrospira sp. OLB3]MBV6469333.1 hypothetical protein [Nitrospirota bacterium]MCK6494215.1 LPP20 family lipoprotein [Nitrospira sp.]MEB2340340.1 LPP20 family lipoprotein [Nitrospirales bacterium]QOJ36835.1 MAG: LPP20 family lipoprotein [Nitrospira sp.]